MITKPKVQRLRVKTWLDGIGGGTATLNTLEKLRESIATEIYRQVELGPGEEALLGNADSSLDWCLLTTSRLIWHRKDALHALLWSEIVGAQQPPEQSAKIIRGELSKDQVTDLEIFDYLGRRYLLSLEAGTAYYIIWSVILDFCDYSRVPDPIPL